ncbi:DUF1778 domain-containing protein [Paracoccus luteus]|uniref:type II toxin-antitoxin system TacA family antitoxin n=1 Tax=Paracoccus luteus TaxID=2508543 RepID=UPI00106F4796|nr:DUF1778 domain-containing protein [Paracoccus luteus]
MTQNDSHPMPTGYSETDIALMDMAASLRGLLRAEFIQQAAASTPEKLLKELQPILMSAEGFAEFLALLDAPATSVPEMVEVLRRLAPWEADHDSNA